jgi:hypothetical protein
MGLGAKELAIVIEKKTLELRGRVPKCVLEDAFGAPKPREFISDTHVDFSRAATRIRRAHGLAESGEIGCVADVPIEIAAALNYIEAYSGIVPIKQTIPLVLALGLYCEDFNVLKLS